MAGSEETRMSAARKIKVLIVDDSALFRATLARALGEDPVIDVVATASDPFEARDLIIRHRPDLMICDIEMPRMNGIEFIRRLLPQYPIPVIVVSSVSEAVFDAISAGAVDFVSKPNPGNRANLQSFLQEMIRKTVLVSSAKVRNAGRVPPFVEPQQPQDHSNAGRGIIAIGASTGGTEAIAHILKHLPTSMPGIAVVQHIPPVFSRMFADRLRQTTGWNAREARTGDLVESGHVYVAPGDQHLQIKRAGTTWRLVCVPGDKVNGHCPSVDVLFQSAALEAGADAVGVILTGMGHDGAKGLLAMRNAGAYTIGQNESSSVVYGMPKAAFELGAVRRQSPLQEISQLLMSICQ